MSSERGTLTFPNSQMQSRNLYSAGNTAFGWLNEFMLALSRAHGRFWRTISLWPVSCDWSRHVRKSSIATNGILRLSPVSSECQTCKGPQTARGRPRPFALLFGLLSVLKKRAGAVREVQLDAVTNRSTAG
jgi:hypothetical protein